MKNRKHIIQMLLESLVICLLSMTVGLAVNYRFVLESLDGRLIAAIREHLNNDVEDDINHEEEWSEIIPIDSTAARDVFDTGEAFFIDVRPSASYNKGHIPGAVNITGQTIDAFLVDIMERAQEMMVITYCTGPGCPQAKEFAELLVQSGLTPVYVYTGGWEQWREHDYPAATGEKP